MGIVHNIVLAHYAQAYQITLVLLFHKIITFSITFCIENRVASYVVTYMHTYVHS